ncbi:hypothetical protein DSO57_1028450 [Entomophthora muscae]|uniref:Uncharacterized protein n=1 Tax=Entomophthora muscae TaxID=34485 RepID=A0ACC2T1C6_9FUNG|nr:hypothetical protein DSO57_1028450 [Entomophthora muscae]
MFPSCLLLLYSLPISFCVRIDNSPPLEPQAQERELNPELGSPRPPGLWTARPHFSGFEPPQADVEEDDPPSKAD